MTDASTNPFDAIGFEPDPTPPPAPSVDADSGASDHDIIVHPLARTQTPPPAPLPSAAAGTPGVPKVAAGVTPAPAAPANPFDAIGFEDPPPSSVPDTPAYGTGVLSNTANDSTMSGTLKNIGSTTIRGLAHAPGFVGDIANFADTLTEIPEYLESKITGQPFADVVAKRNASAAKSEAQQDQFEKGLLGFSIDPRHYLPSGSDISNWIGKYTGSYQPQTTLGRYGSAAGEAALGAFGPRRRPRACGSERCGRHRSAGRGRSHR